jgi:hypothetical protein
MNLPSERLILAFGVGLAAAAYAYWTVDSLRAGLGWTGGASLRAGGVLGAMLLLAVILRAIRAVSER